MSLDKPSVGFEYKARQFQRLPLAVRTHLSTFITRPDNIVRLETANSLGRPPLEGVWGVLITECGWEINDPPVRREIDHMVKQIMESLGHDTCKRRRRRRRRSELFSIDNSFHPRAAAGPDQFNRWLDRQVISPDGEIDPEKLANVAAQWGVSLSAPRDVVIGRLELGVKLRAVVPTSEYETAETSADDE